MTTAEIREAFLKFFESKEHTRVDSASLIPAGDPTLLFTNAGMVPFKDTFLGTEKRPYTRATTCQKSLRISGKHNDLENVGRTARHHTFFEMLGNFSFGDYFKEDAIKFAWEFVTEHLDLPKERLWVTVFEDDDEAAELWSTLTDVRKERILRYGEKDNFWAMGETGPCGPCSEIFYYLGDDVAGQSEEEFRQDDGTYVEIWNLVFMQFNRDPQGNLNPLPKPSVDTGMGLERVAAIKQGVLSNYDSDTLRALITETEKLSGKVYNGNDYSPRNGDEQYDIDVALRVVADHVRASVFLIADGIHPSSDGRGYVLRRLIRRACRHGRVLGFKEAFLCKVSEIVAREMGSMYPNIVEQKDSIAKIIRGEEEKFIVTLDTGMGILAKEVDSVVGKGSKVFPGVAAFTLHDTYGFPLDMTEDIVQGHGLSVDHEAFSAEMESQRERSRSARASEVTLMLQRSVKPTSTEFVGYDYSEYESTVLGLFDKDGDVGVGNTGDEIALVAAQTPFYAESGGQVGDSGTVSTNSCSLDVVDTLKVGLDTIVHIARVTEGSIAVGDSIRLAIDETRRNRLRVNHSATHLLHLALRDVLGDHVKQAGSRVSDQSLRFDFSHSEQVSRAQLEEIEDIVNQQIRANHQIVTEVMSIEDAKKSGATALFGEKYGQSVRVVQIGPRSMELCGGTHAGRSGDIGSCVIFAESAVASGTRRVEAYAGLGAFRFAQEQRRIINELNSNLKSTSTETVERVQRLLERNKDLEREVEQLGQKVNQSKGGDLTDGAVILDDGTKIITGVLEGTSPKQLRQVADDLRARMGSGCIALACVSEGKASVLTAVTPDLVDRYHAGNLIKELSEVLGGRGGGKADLAQAGGGDPAKIDQAFERFQELIA